MTPQTNGTPDLNYSEENFRELYEALKGLMEIAEIAMPDTYFESDSRVNKAREALAKAEEK